MATPPADGDRLDSWKAIADYLGRDVATVRRWEKEAGLPVRRVAATRGHSVFAFRSEIDEWLKKWERGGASPALPDMPTAAAPPPLTTRARPAVRHAALGAGLLVAGITLLTWQVWPWGRDSRVHRVEVTESHIDALGTDGTRLWRHALPSTERAIANATPFHPPAVSIDPDGPVLVATAYSLRRADETALSGRVHEFASAGRLTRAFAFDDTVTFTGGPFGQPWIVTDVRPEPKPGGRLAVAAHHAEWWPGLLTILDENWHRLGTFVNAGWIERVHWISPDRLVVAGYSNIRDGGMVALLDAARPGGQSPAAEGTPYRCTSCGAESPLRYVVFPRSELNRATVSPFNRAVLQVHTDRLIVRSIEVPAAHADAIDALYELTPDLTLIRAEFSDRYWEVHRALEAQGRIDHTRAACPDRSGPPAVEVWEPGTGWRTVRTDGRQGEGR